VSFVAVAPFALMFNFWSKAQTRDWGWTSEDSRDGCVDSAKTLITASGIAVPQCAEGKK
jgi:hypothetical protein